MCRPILIVAVIAALCASPALAADETVAAPVEQQQQSAANKTTTPAHCWKENPYNEFRDCVNAATRDPNAKIRMA